MAVKTEKEVARTGNQTCSFYSESLTDSAEFRKVYRKNLSVIKAEDMPFENSPDGLIKHLMNEKMDSTECCIDVYMQFLKPKGRSGKHRHLAEEVMYILEGEGYSLHWDVKFECVDTFNWAWEEEPKRFDWKRGDFVFVPSYSIHQNFNASADGEARFLVMHNRIMKAMGLHWHEQVENADTYEGDLPTELAGPGWNPDTRDEL